MAHKAKGQETAWLIRAKQTVPWMSSVMPTKYVTQSHLPSKVKAAAQGLPLEEHHELICIPDLLKHSHYPLHQKDNSSERGKQCSLPKAMIQNSGFLIPQHGDSIITGFLQDSFLYKYSLLSF